MLSSYSKVSGSRFPDEIEWLIFLEGAKASSESSTDSSDKSVAGTSACPWKWLLVVKRVYRWLEPVLYDNVDIICQQRADHFASSLRPRPDFARTAVKVLRLRPAISPEKGTEILQLCQGLQELTLEIIVELPDDQNPLRAPLNVLQLTSLSINLSSGFYGPYITLAELDILCHVERLHLSNSWVGRRGLHMGLHKLNHLTHISFPTHPTGQLFNRTLCYILKELPRLQVAVLWVVTSSDDSEESASGELCSLLKSLGLDDERVVVFDAEQFSEHENDFWELAESIVRRRRTA
ncbi:hypothetical protein V8E55_005209 [Tylopilus felleus]